MGKAGVVDKEYPVTMEEVFDGEVSCKPGSLT